MTPTEYYSQQIKSGLIEKDSQQLDVIGLLQQVYDGLVEQSKDKSGIARWMKSFIKPKAVKGLYAWGSVGVGKTFLMDTFYLCCPVKKMRLHFHRFLQRIHAELQQMQGQVDPLVKIAKKLSLEASVICFDEFFVEDIADAMILGELFTALFAEGVCLVTTSNVDPDDLYKEGLQRERFLPAIAMIKQYTTVFHMVSHHDYRLTHLHQAGVYFSPLNKQSAKYMETAFQHLANDKVITQSDLELLGRTIKTQKQTDGMIWFEFLDLCSVPRSQNDYIEMAKIYHTVFISNIPVLKARDLKLTTAFINLIDVFYDAAVRVVISAETDIEDLYPVGQLRFEFARTQSRLIEMQSTDYFNQRSREHESLL